MNYIWLLWTVCSCTLKSFPKTEDGDNPQSPSKSETFTIINKTIIGERSGVKTNVRIFLRDKLPNYLKNVILDTRQERIKKRSLGTCRFIDETLENDSERGFSTIFDNDSHSSEKENSSIEDMNVSKIDRIRRNIFTDITKTISKAINTNHYFEFALQPKFSHSSKYIIFFFKDNVVEIIEREIRNSKVINRCVFVIFNIFNDIDLLNTNEPILVKAKRLVAKILSKTLAIGLISIDNPEHFAFVMADKNDWKRTELNDLFMYPYYQKMKDICIGTMEEMGIQYSSIVFANSSYYRIIEATLNTVSSHNPQYVNNRFDESAFRSVVSHRKVEDYFPTELRKESFDDINSGLVVEALPFTNIDLKEGMNLVTSPEFQIKLFFDTTQDKFTLFVVYIKNGIGKIFHLNLNKKCYDELLRYKIEDLQQLKNSKESCSILSDYMIASLGNISEETDDIKEMRRNLKYNLLFCDRNQYIIAIKSLALDYKNEKNNFFDLLSNQFSQNMIEMFKKQTCSDENITLDDVFLCERIRSLHDTDFINTEEFSLLKSMLLEKKNMHSNKEIKKKIKIFTEDNLLEIRKFMCEEIVEIISKITNEKDMKVELLSKYESKKSLSKTSDPTWELTARMITKRDELWDIFAHQEEMNEGIRSILYLD
ncbi:hypothetical protein NGRA_0969 [Nosema granulosis]|uniref:Uncharacterized protein n=1 Tax=Nosema granulosis TaxID=83296 RepID=A0A9P6KZT8_9MICR|nr:hypothetical protein NGRA_0969 [Nosema granulosis]